MKSRTFTDLDLNFQVHPVNKDLFIKIDEEAVKGSITNLIMTNFFERKFHPELSSNVTALLFEPYGLMTNIVIKRTIRDVIQNFEPRVNLIDIIVNEDQNQNALNVTIMFSIINTVKPITLNLVLERTR